MNTSDFYCYDEHLWVFCYDHCSCKQLTDDNVSITTSVTGLHDVQNNLYTTFWYDCCKQLHHI